ncbi:MAG: rod shape-determining protein MreC [Actinomycetota bacterium]
MGTQTNTSLGKRRVAIRRSILGGLVVLSVVLFSTYFREGDAGGPLHGVQARAGALVTPLESITDRAVQPFRDGWDWVSDLLDARGRAERLEKENAQLKAALVESVSRAEELTRLQALTGFPDEIATGYRRIPARILGRSPLNLYSRARLSVGTGDGVVNNSIVVTGNGDRGALVGYVISAQGGSSVVSFITDPRTGVGVRVQGSGNAPAILRATFQGQLELENVRQDFPLTEGAAVETAGFSEPGLPSIYPSGIPVGQVVEFGMLEADVYQRVQVRPLVDVRTLSEVIVLAPVSDEAKRRASGA